MELKEVQRHWDAFGKTDPLWAIVAQPEKRHGKWKHDEFFACGEEEIERILSHVASLSFPLRRGRALDFGCGAGRLTQALSRHFQLCDGVDIAPSMIELARRLDRPWRRLRYEAGRLWRGLRSGHFRWADSWPGLARLLRGNKCRYVVNDSNDLALFRDDTFDLIYSSLVLQHMKPEYSQNYIKEFLRVLAAGGLIIFQIPSRPRSERDLPYKASIRVDRTSFAGKCGERIRLGVQVKNLSESTWPAVNLGNHWLSETGELLALDDVRAGLPAAMGPGQEVQVSITVTAPRSPGHYWLELDVVWESKFWFKAMGSQTARIACQVHAASHERPVLFRRLKERIRVTRGYRLGAQLYRRLRRPAVTPAPAFEPVMETYGVPRDGLVKWIENHGGRIVEIQNDWSVGKEWESFRYYVTKP